MAKRKFTRHAISSHARKRMQERGISKMQVLLIETFGQYNYQKGGTDLAYIPAKVLRELRHAIDKIEGVSAVIGDSGKVITVMHQERKIRTTQYSS